MPHLVSQAVAEDGVIIFGRPWDDSSSHKDAAICCNGMATRHALGGIDACQLGRHIELEGKEEEGGEEKGRERGMERGRENEGKAISRDQMQSYSCINIEIICILCEAN